MLLCVTKQPAEPDGTAALSADPIGELAKAPGRLCAVEIRGQSSQGQKLLPDLIDPHQRRGLCFLEVAIHGIPGLTVQILQAGCLRVDGRSHGTGPEGAVISLLHDKQDFVDRNSCSGVASSRKSDSSVLVQAAGNGVHDPSTQG